MNDFRQRVMRTATLTRDLMVHDAVSRWEVFVKASALAERCCSHNDVDHNITVEETGVALRTYVDGSSGFAAASGLDVDASRRAIEGARSMAAPVPFDPIPPAHYLGQTNPGDPPRPLSEDWVDELIPRLALGIQSYSADRLELRSATVRQASYSWLLTNSEGFVASYEGATKALRVESALRLSSPGLWREWFHVPDEEDFNLDSAVAQICDRALLETGAVFTRSGLTDVIVHSEIVAELIAALTPLFLAGGCRDEVISKLVNSDGLLTGEDLTLVDDRIGPGVPIVAPCDGEGLPASRTLVLDRGVPRHRIGSYRDALLNSETPRGGAVRISYRDYPVSGIGNLRVDTTPAVSPGELLQNAPKSVYLLRPLAPIRVHAERDEYRILASGVWIDGGVVQGRQPVIELRGSIPQLLRRLDGIGNDLRWHQTEAGLIGATSVLLRRQRVL